MPRTRITTAPWVYIALTFCATLCASGAVVLSNDPGWEFWVLLGMVLMSLIALLEAFFAKVESDGDIVRIVHNFRKLEIQKTSIEKVSWEKGSGSFLKLTDGTFVKLPVTGRNEQGVANSVRSWIGRS